MNIILLGLPGAGKGTQAKSIVDNCQIPHISTGDLFRKAYQAQTELGLLANAYMSKGELVPNEVTIGIAHRRLEDADCSEGFLLDGFPRNLVQADALEHYLTSRAKNIDHVIYVEVDMNLLLSRLTGRRVCSSCGETFHLASQPPKAAGQCDSCNGVLIQREDDREETVTERLRVNFDLTNSLVRYYEEKGILRTVDGSQDIAQVKQHILNVLR
jgi:adenylate kinase